ncbi:MAG: trypsin-like peptidase domain-containing protein, partial [Rubritalea sp.]|uniref:S1C family serine protease n=1 Tax=Rubritalea sp. TaxID=2109375 RepID=UPI003242DC6D
MTHITKYCTTLIGVVGLMASPLLADAPSVTSVAQLKELQNKIQEVVRVAQPATVALTSNRTGSWGSGVVVSESGTILTAAHVVHGAKTVVVIFPDGSEASADVLGANRTKDTAILKIREAETYPYVEMGDSDPLEVGNFLVAMGHAGGYDALRKPPVRFGRLVSKNVGGYFSSDCALIGGDSGGPIFDIEGKLVGINSSIGEDRKANNHAGLSALKADWKRLESGETWGSLSSNQLANNDSPILGVAILGSTAQGVLLGEVVPGGPAQRAGFKARDIILNVEGHKVNNGGQLLIELNKFRPGQTVTLEVLR